MLSSFKILWFTQVQNVKRNQTGCMKMRVSNKSTFNYWHQILYIKLILITKGWLASQKVLKQIVKDNHRLLLMHLNMPAPNHRHTWMHPPTHARVHTHTHTEAWRYQNPTASIKTQLCLILMLLVYLFSPKTSDIVLRKSSTCLLISSGVLKQQMNIA